MDQNEIELVKPSIESVEPKVCCGVRCDPAGGRNDAALTMSEVVSSGETTLEQIRDAL